MVGSIILLSEDATKENNEYFNSSRSMVRPDKKLIRGLSDDTINKFTYYNLSYMPK